MTIWTFSRKRTTPPFTWHTWRNGPNRISSRGQGPACASCKFKFKPALQQCHKNLGYLLGKAEGDGELWHGHVSAVTVAPEYRRLGLAATLMATCEHKVCGVQGYTAYYFVDLFVCAPPAVWSFARVRASKILGTRRTDACWDTTVLLRRVARGCAGYAQGAITEECASAQHRDARSSRAARRSDGVVVVVVVGAVALKYSIMQASTCCAVQQQHKCTLFGTMDIYI